MANRQETYLFGQGKVEVAELTSNGPGDWAWLGDVSELTLAFEEEKFTHKESYSGNRSEVRELSVGVSMNASLTIHELSADNVALFTRGKRSSITAGTVTDESLGTVTAGSVVQLAKLGVSDLVISDSTGAPVVIGPEHYEVDAFGEISFLSLPTTPAPTMPLKASYSHAAAEQTAFLGGAKKDYMLRYKGINLAEGNKPVLVELYKVSASLLQQLSLITNGNELASAPVEFKPLLDAGKSASGDLGQYGRIVTVGY